MNVLVELMVNGRNLKLFGPSSPNMDMDATSDTPGKSLLFSDDVDPCLPPHTLRPARTPEAQEISGIVTRHLL